MRRAVAKVLLYVMRHGDAISRARTDQERPLSPLGEAQARSMVSVLLPQPPARILVSPYLRAQQTAALVAAGLAHHDIVVPLETIDFITPNDSPQVVLTNLEPILSTGEAVLIVSHQPLAGGLVTWFAEGHTMGLPVATASIACLKSDVVAAGVAELLWLQSPST